MSRAHGCCCRALRALGSGAAPAERRDLDARSQSGTTEEITAIEYRGGDQFWFTTASGKIFQRVGGTFAAGVQRAGRRASATSSSRRGGHVGLAVGTNGRRRAQPTTAAPTGTSSAIPTGGQPDERDGLRRQPAGRRRPRHGRASTATATGLDRRGRGAQIWRVDRRPAPRSARAGRTPTTARGNATARSSPRDVDGMFFVPGSAAGYFIARSFGQVSTSPTNSLVGAREPKPGAARQRLPVPSRRVAGDPANPNRMWAVVPGTAAPRTSRRTDDGWNTEADWRIANDDERSVHRRATTSTTPAARSLAAGERAWSCTRPTARTSSTTTPTARSPRRTGARSSLADGANGADRRHQRQARASRAAANVDARHRQADRHDRRPGDRAARAGRSRSR